MICVIYLRYFGVFFAPYQIVTVCIDVEATANCMTITIEWRGAC